jgi:hypothetical protein
MGSRSLKSTYKNLMKSINISLNENLLLNAMSVYQENPTIKRYELPQVSMIESYKVM